MTAKECFMKRIGGFSVILVFLLTLSLAFLSCEIDDGNSSNNNNNNSTFVAVTDITGVPESTTVGDLTLSGTVVPDTATNKTITWSVQSVGTTGATISGTNLKTTATGTVTVRASITNGSAASTAYTKDFEITINPQGQVFTSIATITSYLNGLSDNTADNPHPLAVNIDLGNMPQAGSGWRELLDAIQAAGKFVNLDLSACTMEGTEFNGGTGFATGKARIVSMILPNAAESVTGIGATDTNNMHFTNLKSASGSGITNIGFTAFTFCTSLTSVSFPAAANIGNSAFTFCNSLTSVSIPATASIGDSAFSFCNSLTIFNLTGSGDLSTIENRRALVLNGTELLAYPSASSNITLDNITSIGRSAFEGSIDLTSANFPNVTSIGSYAFSNTGLESANFPNVIDIGDGAFNNNFNLTVTNFQAATSINLFAFAGCTSLISVSIPNITSISDYAFDGSYNLSNVTLGTISENNFGLSNTFRGNLRTVYFASGGGAGTYIVVSTGWPITWAKQQ